MKNALISLIVVGVGICLFSAYKIYTNGTPAVTISSYEGCVAAGYPILESYPEQCKTPDGQTFVNPNATPVVPPPTETPPSTPPAQTNEQKSSAAAKNELAKELKIDEKLITVTEIKPANWSDGCLGLSTPDEICSQAIIAGYKITLTAATKTYIYRTNSDGTSLRREK